MRITHVVSSLKVGGQEVIALQLAQAQSDAGHHVEITALRDGPLRQRLAPSVPVTLFDESGAALAAAVTRHFLRRRFDVVNSHNPSAQRLAGFARLAGWPRIVMTLHGEASRSYAAITTRVTLDHLIPVSSRVADAFVARHPHFAPGRMTVIDNGVVIREAKDPDEASRSSLTILVTARLDPIKDLGTLLAAVALLRVTRAVRLLIAGDGLDRGPLEARAQELGVTDIVTFLGMMADVHPLYLGADIFALSSKSEGMSLAILDAMAAGVPVVATAVGGTPDIITDGVTGLLVPPGDPAAMAGAIARLADTPSLRRQIVARARQRVVENFSLTATAGKYLALYQSLR